MRLPVLLLRPRRRRAEPVDVHKATAVADMSPALRGGERLELVGPTRHLERIYYIGFIKSRSAFGRRRPPNAILVTCPGEGIVSQGDTARELLHCAILASLLFHDRSNLVKKMGGNNQRLRSRLPVVRAALEGDERLRKLGMKLDSLEAEVERQDRVLERMFNIESLFDRSSTPDTELPHEWIALYHETVDLYEALVSAFEAIWGSEEQRRHLKLAFRAERHDSMSMHDMFIDLKMMRHNIGELERLLDRAGFYADSYMELWQPKLQSLH